VDKNGQDDGSCNQQGRGDDRKSGDGQILDEDGDGSECENETGWDRINECAAILSIDVGAYTLRELFSMVKFRQKIQWDHTSLLMSGIVWSSSGKWHDPKKWNPYSEYEADSLYTVNDVSQLADIYIDKEIKRPWEKAKQKSREQQSK